MLPVLCRRSSLRRSLFLELFPDWYFVVVLMAVPPGLFVVGIPAGVVPRLLSPQDQDLLDALV